MNHEELSKEYYSLSKIKYLLKKELNSINKALYNLDLKRMILINESNTYKINDLAEFNDQENIQTLKVKPNNGIQKTIAIIKTNDLFIDRKLDKFSQNLNKNIDYVAIDVQRRYVIKNEEYFKTHFDPIYIEYVKDPNEKLNELKNNSNIFDLELNYNFANYKINVLNSSRKQNLINVKDSISLLIESLNGYDSFEKTIILNKNIKSIENRLNEIEEILLKDYKFVDNDYCTKETIDKNECIDINVNYSTDDMINKVLNGDAMIKRAISKGKPILSEMYEEKLEFKIMEIGSKDEVINKINFVINSINEITKENNEDFEKVLNAELKSDMFS